MCSLWQGLSDGKIHFEHVTLTVTFPLLLLNLNIAPANLHNALQGPTWLCQYSSHFYSENTCSYFWTLLSPGASVFHKHALILILFTSDWNCNAGLLYSTYPYRMKGLWDIKTHNSFHKYRMKWKFISDPIFRTPFIHRDNRRQIAKIYSLVNTCIFRMAVSRKSGHLKNKCFTVMPMTTAFQTPLLCTINASDCFI